MTRRKTKGLPPLPKEVFHPLGAVSVKLVTDLKDEEGRDIFGCWSAFDRTIEIRAGMHPTAAWSTLWHERTHADLSDIGVSLSCDQEEAVANAIALARVAELLATLSP